MGINPFAHGAGRGILRGGIKLEAGEIATNNYSNMIGDIMRGKSIETVGKTQSARQAVSPSTARNWMDALQDTSGYKAVDDFVHKNSETVVPQGRRTASDIINQYRGVRSGLDAQRQEIVAAQRRIDRINAAGKADEAQAAGLDNLTSMMNRDDTSLMLQGYYSYAQEGAALAWRGVQHLTEGGAGAAAMKIGGVAAIYGGGNLVGRGLTGGGLTYNSKGERDIAGIPFF